MSDAVQALTKQKPFTAVLPPNHSQRKRNPVLLTIATSKNGSSFKVKLEAHYHADSIDKHYLFNLRAWETKVSKYCP